ncbi:MAG: GntR family transcriptional regulator [Acidimicrobiales bacterium]
MWTEAVDHSKPIPLYYQFKQWLSVCISNGTLPPGSRLPDELELCQRLGVSRGVVRQALTELGYEGVIYRQRGRGTFVSTHKTAEGLISGLRGLVDDAALRGQVVQSKVLVLRQVPATNGVAANLNIAVNELVVELERVRALDGEPHVLTVTYLPAALVPGLARRDLSGAESLYQVLRQDYRLPIVSSRRRVEAATAGAREARLLEVDRGAPLLVLYSTSYTTERRALEYFTAFHRGDRSAFEVELSSSGVNASRFERVPLAPESSVP